MNNSSSELFHQSADAHEPTRKQRSPQEQAYLDMEVRNRADKLLSQLRNADPELIRGIGSRLLAYVDNKGGQYDR